MSSLQALRQHDGASVDSVVRTGALGTLARLAVASARLHLRDTVLAMPDAVHAILVFEASSEAKVTAVVGLLQCM